MKECSTCSRCFPDSSSLCPTDGSLLKTTLAVELLLDGRYELRKRLGQGGMGVVFKARHIFLKTTHAIKVILPDLAGGDPEFLTRFRQEAMAAAAIRHHNIIAVTDYGVLNNSTPFLVMEFIQGKSLHDILVDEKRLAPERALEIMQAVGAGVGAAHRRGIVHRDLKPLNIMVEDDLPLTEAVKVLDFGLAKIKSGELLGSFVAAKTLGLMGSPYYMAPEQWSEEEPEKSADIYSLGIILYQMLAGEVPFKGPNAPAIMKKHLMDAPPSFAEVGAAVPTAVEGVVRRALEKRPELRPPTVLDLVNELRDAVNSSKPTPAMPATTPHFIHSTQDKFASTIPSDALYEADLMQADLVREKRQREEEEEERRWAEAEQQRPEAEPRRYQEEEEHRRREEGEEARARAHSGHELPGTGAEATDVSNVTWYAPPRATNPREQLKGSLAGEAGINVPPGADPTDRQMSRLAIQISAPEAGPGVVKRPLRWALIGGTAAAVALTSAFAMVIYRSASSSVGNDKSPVTTITTGEPIPPPPGSDQILIPGGTFQMGLSDLPANVQALPEKNQLWFYSQWPAHPVTVNSFYIDRTEVTNAEYAQCVRQRVCDSPEDWSDGDPPKGRDLHPVINVSKYDAEDFAAWRSRRDGVTYRLPSEVEWEYAARGGGKDQPYPWGDEWEDGRAIIDTEEVQPVGSHPTGRTDQGVEDMIGNVREWTSSTASKYKRNDRMMVRKEHENHIVIRGGSYESKAEGENTRSRAWLPPEIKSPDLGFRLVQEAP